MLVRIKSFIEITKKIWLEKLQKEEEEGVMGIDLGTTTL